MEKMCILDERKKCNECGNCDICDLNPDKICDNCGKCINMENGEGKDILIDKIIEDPDEIKEYEEGFSKDNLTGSDENLLNDYDDDYVRDEKDDLPSDLELIDDIDGLSEMLQDEKIATKLLEEKSPGFFVIKNN